MNISLLFNKLKTFVMRMAKSPRALVALAFVGFCEPIFLAIFPELILVPVAMSRPERRLELVVFTATLSTMGAFVAYYIGFYAGGYFFSQATLSEGMIGAFFLYVRNYGAIFTFIASLTPFPLKIVTLVSGMSQLSLWSFLPSIAFGRLIRFGLVVFFTKKRKVTIKEV